MIIRGTAGFVVMLLVMFSLAAWGGYAARARWASSRQLDQPGWCCPADKGTCAVADSADACTGRGGTVFNWDQEICNTICGEAKMQQTRGPGAAVSAGAAVQ